MSDTKYVLTEELRDRLIGNLEAMALADFYAHSNKEQAELLRNLPTVQATVVPSEQELLELFWKNEGTPISHHDGSDGIKAIRYHLLTHGYREQSNLLDLAHKVIETQASNTMTHEQAADLVAKSEANIVQGYREQLADGVPSWLIGELESLRESAHAGFRKGRDRNYTMEVVDGILERIEDTPPPSNSEKSKSEPVAWVCQRIVVSESSVNKLRADGYEVTPLHIGDAVPTIGKHL